MGKNNTSKFQKGHMALKHPGTMNRQTHTDISHTYSSTSFRHNPEVRAEFISLNHADEHDLGRPWHPVTSAPLSRLALHL